jgi:hypothetical protein
MEVEWQTAGLPALKSGFESRHPLSPSGLGARFRWDGRDAAERERATTRRPGAPAVTRRRGRDLNALRARLTRKASFKGAAGICTRVDGYADRCLPSRPPRQARSKDNPDAAERQPGSTPCALSSAAGPPRGRTSCASMPSTPRKRVSRVATDAGRLGPSCRDGRIGRRYRRTRITPRRRIRRSARGGS